MLTRFNVGNFLSFKEVQEFSMLKGKPISKGERVYDSGKLKVLKFGALFGANASGKSNFVKSIAFARDLIVPSLQQRRPLGEFAFKLDGSYQIKPSYFEFEILLDDCLYSYGFEIILKEDQFVSEWLIKLSPTGSDFKIFSRDIMSGEITTDLKIEDRSLRNKFKVYLDDIRGNRETLFLSEMNRNKNQLYAQESSLTIIKKVFDWFSHDLEIVYPNKPISPLANFWASQEKEQICKIIKDFSTGIVNYEEVEVDLEQELKYVQKSDAIRVKNYIDELQKMGTPNRGIILNLNDSYFFIMLDEDRNISTTSLKFSHGEGTPLFDFIEESDGTRRILDLLEILLTKEDKVFVIDEIDRSLHPQLTYRFIKYFLHLANKRNIQLIVTTHESRLLDFDLLRQDEIWLSEKNLEGATVLYSLDEYNVRFDRKVDKAYLEGRYGGVPIFKSLFPLEE
jgi:AAA15 family ATPase/GTPase